ncbi:MAG TPA: hypothetical protein VGB91_07385 [Rhizomicrobium sp.]
MINETLSIFIRSFARAPLAWLLLLVAATGTNLVDLVYGVQPGHKFSALQVVSVAVRLVGVYWLAAVALRRMVGHPAKAWAPDRGVAFLVLWTIGLFVVEQAGGVGLVVAAKAFQVGQANARVTVVLCIALATVIVDLAVLRIVPWPVARTARVREFIFGAAWRGMRGKWRAAAGAYLVLVFGLFALHLGLTAWLQLAPPPRPLLIGWTVFDGVESVMFLMMALALNATAYGRARPM